MDTFEIMTKCMMSPGDITDECLKEKFEGNPVPLELLRLLKHIFSGDNPREAFRVLHRISRLSASMLERVAKSNFSNKDKYLEELAREEDEWPILFGPGKRGKDRVAWVKGLPLFENYPIKVTGKTKPFNEGGVFSDVVIWVAMFCDFRSGRTKAATDITELDTRILALPNLNSAKDSIASWAAAIYDATDQILVRNDSIPPLGRALVQEEHEMMAEHVRRDRIIEQKNCGSTI